MSTKPDHAVVLDVVLRVPTEPRQQSIECSNSLASLMDEHGGACFRLGDPFPGDDDGSCEPHVSLFMLTVDESEVDGVVAALAEVAAGLSAFHGRATEYRFNHEGAPEVFYERSDAWRQVQRAVVTAVEPLRRGRLREFGPGGEALADVVSQAQPDDPALVRQLLAYGYDAVSDDQDDRFDPHVTLTWPRDESVRVDLSSLPELAAFDGTFDELGLYVMGPNGTCTHVRGTWALA